MNRWIMVLIIYVIAMMLLLPLMFFALPRGEEWHPTKPIVPDSEAEMLAESILHEWKRTNDALEKLNAVYEYDSRRNHGE